MARKPSEKSRAGHQARDDMFGQKIGGKRPQASRSPFSEDDRRRGKALTKKIVDRARKKGK
jgi:hypothetical protein